MLNSFTEGLVVDHPVKGDQVEQTNSSAKDEINFPCCRLCVADCTSAPADKTQSRDLHYKFPVKDTDKHILTNDALATLK